MRLEVVKRKGRVHIRQDTHTVMDLTIKEADELALKIEDELDYLDEGDDDED